MVFKLPLRNKAAPERQIGSIAEFSRPPLDEVVLGIQFNRPPHLRSVHYGDVYHLFRREYPVVEDQPKLIPNFETFGGNPQNGPTFQFGNGPTLDRIWMIAPDGNHLVQFQEDRFFINWRRRDLNDRYPRYEKVVSSFEKSLTSLSTYFTDGLGVQLEITQAEISYINLQPIGDITTIADWVNVVGRSTLQPEAFNLIFTEVLIRDNRPIARMHYLIQSAIMNDEARTPAFRFEITCRGAPKDMSLKEALSFLDMGREAIVKRFCSMTTEEAHAAWGRTK